MRIPHRVQYVARCLGNGTDLRAALAFLATGRLTIPFRTRLRFVYDLYRISMHVDCAHTEAEILAIATEIIGLPPSVRGCIVVAGCYKGGATAKLSLAARFSGRMLYAFDPFQGLPTNGERSGVPTFGENTNVVGGGYRADEQEVVDNVSTYGAVRQCQFLKGWFHETMPSFTLPVAVGFLNVDLASSTRTSLKYLYPQLQPGGTLFSHDGHVPSVAAVFRDQSFWMHAVRCPPPRIDGLGTTRLLRVPKSTPSPRRSDRVHADREAPFAVYGVSIDGDGKFQRIRGIANPEHVQHGGRRDDRTVQDA